MIEDAKSVFQQNRSAAASDIKFFKQHEFDWYGQDTWKVRSNLTLNIGLRYQSTAFPTKLGRNFSNILQDPATFLAGQPVTFTIVGPARAFPLSAGL